MNSNPQLISITDTRFDEMMTAWTNNIVSAVKHLHQFGSDYFGDDTFFFTVEDVLPDREQTVIEDIQKIVSKCRKMSQKTILIGYDTKYLQPALLEAILCKIRAKKAYKRFQISQITAAKLTESVDYLLYEDYYIPDLIFVVIQRV